MNSENKTTKKSIFFMLAMFLLTSSIISIIYFLIEFLILNILNKSVNIDIYLDNIYLNIINVVLKVIIYTFTFKKLLLKRYKIDASKYEFLYKFLLLIIILFCFTLGIRFINAKQHIYTRIQATLLSETWIRDALEEKNMDKFKEYINGTPWEEEYNKNGSILNGTMSIIEKILNDELYEYCIIIFTEAITNVLVIIAFVRKEEEVFEE